MEWVNNGLEGLWEGWVTPDRWTRLTDRRIAALLRRVVDLAAMTVIAPPRVWRHDHGTDAMILLAESHAWMTVKSVGPAQWVWFDLFSCNPFEPAPITLALRRTLGDDIRLTRTVQRSIAPPDLRTGG